MKWGGLVLALLAVWCVGGPVSADEAEEVATARRLLDEGVALQRAGRSAEAIAPLERSVEIRRRLGSDAGATILALSWLGRALIDASRHEAALTVFDEELALRRAAGETETLGILVARSGRAFAIDGIGRALDALAERESLLALARRLFPGDHGEAAMALRNLAASFAECGRPAEAVPLLEQAVSMLRRLHGDDAIEVLPALQNLGVCLDDLGRSEEAVAVHSQALSALRAVHGGDHPDLARAMSNLGAALVGLGRLDDGLPHLETALAMRRRLYTGDSYPLVASIGNLASAFDAAGRHEEALALDEEALAMCRRIFPGDHPEVALSLVNLAHTLGELGRVPESRPFEEEALAMSRRLFPGDHPSVALHLNNLAATLGLLGRPEEALPLKVEALAMYRRLYPGDHPLTATALNNLAFGYDDLGRPGEALPLYEEAIAMLRRLPAVDPSALAFDLGNLGAVLTDAERFDEAEAAHREALETYDRLFPEGHPAVPRILGNLAGTMERHGRGEEALELHGRAADMAVRTGSTERRVHLEQYGRALLAAGRTEEAIPPLLAAVEALEGRRSGARGLGTEDRARFLGAMRRWDPYAPLVSALRAAGRIEEAAAALERGRAREMLDLLERGRVDPVARTEEQARADGDARLLRRLAEARDEVARSEVELSRREREEASARSVGERARTREAASATAAARRRLLDAHAALARLVRDAAPETSVRSPAQIRAALAPGERMLLYSLDGPESLAFLLGPGAGPAVDFPLRDGAAPAGSERVEDLVRAALEEMSDPEHTASSASADLFRILFPPEVWDEVREATRLLVVPHGPLHALPFEALVVGEADGRPVPWIEAGPPVAYISSGSVLTWLRERAAARAGEPDGAGILALGDPDFAADGADAPWPESGVLVVSVSPGSQGARMGLRPGDVIAGYGDRPTPDPAALREAIASSRGPQRLRVLRGEEELALAADPGPLGIQIAQEPPRFSGPTLLAGGSIATTRRGLRERTRRLAALPGTRREVEAIARALGEGGAAHEGFTALLGREATEARLHEAAAGATILHLATHGLVDETESASFSALALSVPRVPVPGDDGFLSLADLLGRWRGRLAATRLVVLSACETQKGRLQRDEGILALPWGFHFAGAPSVAEALHAAKRALRSTHPHPFHWAPFVLLGDPR